MVPCFGWCRPTGSSVRHPVRGITHAWACGVLPDVPPAISDLLTGRRRVELTSSEAAEVMAWAGSVEGWDAVEPKPLFIHGSA